MLSSLLETMARRIETPPWHGLYRIAIGFAVVPVFGLWQGGGGSDWRLFLFFLVTLVALRVVPAFGRRLVAFSPDLRAHWCERRLRAKHYDSYQWRKLFWFGLGLAGHLALIGEAAGPQSVLALSCLVAGGLGELRWRAVRASQSLTILLPKQQPT